MLLFIIEAFYRALCGTLSIVISKGKPGTCPNITVSVQNKQVPVQIQSPFLESECARIFLIPLLHPDLFRKILIFIFKIGQKPANLVRNLSMPYF